MSVLFTSRDFSAFVVLSFSFCLFTRNCAIVLNLEGEASWACRLNFAISYSCHFLFFLRNSFSVLRKFRLIFNLANVQFLLFAPFLWRPKYSQAKRFQLRGDIRFRGKTDFSWLYWVWSFNSKNQYGTCNDIWRRGKYEFHLPLFMYLRSKMC